MDRVSPEANPFQPGAGARPPLLAGRDAEQALGGEMLARLKSGRRPPQGILFFGPRGNGKTSLLDDIAEDARGRGIRAEDLAVSSLETGEALVRRLQEKAGLTATRVQNVQFAGTGVSVQPGPPSSDAAALFTAWIEASEAPLVILLDEAQAIPAATGRIFLGAVQAATRRDLPFLLLAAGTPDAPRRLREAGTFTERMFRQVPVGRLRREAALGALTMPAVQAGLPLTPDAAAWLAARSRGYPYFIQLLGSAAWEAAARAGAAEVTLESARAGTASMRPEIERFYAARVQEAHARGVHRALRPLAALISQRGGRVGWDDLDGFLAEHAGAMGEAGLLHALGDLGVLWETSPARWEMGIPSFADFLLRGQSVARRRSAGTPPL